MSPHPQVGPPGANDAGASGALAGIRVLDLSRVLAGPYCTQILGDHGADVIKVESPWGDDTREWGPYLPDGRSAYYESINRNKRNISLDLRSDIGRRALWPLLERADVLVENFRSGSMARWGFDYEEDLGPRFPRLIYCRISGYGEEGPLGGLPGYDAVLQAYSGLMSLNGTVDGPPLRVGVPIVDIVTGIFAVCGVLMALHERERSGLGQLVECTLFDAAVSLLHPHAVGWLSAGSRPARTGSAHPSIAPYDSFNTAGGLIFVSAANNRQFAGLVEVLGCPGLAADERFLTNRRRLENINELRSILSGLVENWGPEELAKRLMDNGVPAAPVNTVADALATLQARTREMVVRKDNYAGLGIPIKLARTPGAVLRVPARQGEHSEEILRSAGLSSNEIDETGRSSRPDSLGLV